jgi:hypothetical protein
MRVVTGMVRILVDPQTRIVNGEIRISGLTGEERVRYMSDLDNSLRVNQKSWAEILEWMKIRKKRKEERTQKNGAERR